MTDILLDKKQAATHLGIPIAILAGQCKLNWPDLHSPITAYDDVSQEGFG